MSSLVYSRYLLWLRAGLARPSFSQERTIEADTPRRCATAPTFSASPTFLGERGDFLRALTLVFELMEEGLDKDISTWSLLWMITCFLSIAVSARTRSNQEKTPACAIRVSRIVERELFFNTRATKPVMFATAKLAPCRLRATGTPGIGRG
jgi:hypothetical protein